VHRLVGAGVPCLLAGEPDEVKCVVMHTESSQHRGGTIRHFYVDLWQPNDDHTYAFRYDRNFLAFISVGQLPFRVCVFHSLLPVQFFFCEKTDVQVFLQTARNN